MIMKHKCECGKEFERPVHYIECKSIINKWKTEHCDDCFNAKLRYHIINRTSEVMYTLSEEEK